MSSSVMRRDRSGWTSPEHVHMLVLMYLALREVVDPAANARYGAVCWHGVPFDNATSVSHDS